MSVLRLMTVAVVVCSWQVLPAVAGNDHPKPIVCGTETPSAPVLPPAVRDLREPKNVIVRDHRKTTGVVIRDHRDSSGVVIRDHREPSKVVVRDHRTPQGPVIRDHRTPPFVPPMTAPPAVNKPIVKNPDAGQAPGGVVVTSKPTVVVRDHRKPSRGSNGRPMSPSIPLPIPVPKLPITIPLPF